MVQDLQIEKKLVKVNCGLEDKRPRNLSFASFMGHSIPMNLGCKQF
jgi:hypothetical protein